MTFNKKTMVQNIIFTFKNKILFYNFAHLNLVALVLVGGHAVSNAGKDCYSKESPAYLVYYPNANSILKHCLAQFMKFWKHRWYNW